MLIRQAARREHDLRDISFIPHVSRSADGSCVVKMGHTHVLCTAVFQTGMEGMGVTYRVLPGATHPRTDREGTIMSFETLHIQSSIAQSLSLVLDVDAFSTIGLTIDCDVLQGEGSLRAAAISGAYVAVALAVKKLTPFNLFTRNPLKGQIASISGGIVKGELIVDLDNEECLQADVLGDFIFNDESHLVNMYIKSQRFPFSLSHVNKIVEACLYGGRFIIEAQRKALLQNA